MTESYSPHKKTEKILDRAWVLVQSVPYSVSARWLFYRLLQEGFYSKKSDYKNKFTKAVSAARKAFYKSWRPDTLADETREAIRRGGGYETVAHWLEELANSRCQLNKWNHQTHYVELWYEARAMTDQFMHYTKHMTLRPMAGQPSIPYKWEAAKDLEAASRRYGVPIVILYFGDLDTAGEIISEAVEQDVRAWCDVDFDFIRCGLTPAQVKFYGVPENFEKPGEYQWEALEDAAAREIITQATKAYLRQHAFDEVSRLEYQATKWLNGELADLPARWEPMTS